MRLRKETMGILGFVCIIISFVLLFVLSMPTISGESVRFSSTYKDSPVTLKGTYWEADDAEYAVLICPGYSCDRQKWRPFADLFVANGCTTMTFDYSGQGGSSGTIGFDNAKTDAIPVQISDAIEVLHDKSGVDYDHIILVGHSMGGRSILRLLYDYNAPDAITTVIKREISNVILISPEVNYNYNAQASLFAGTSDEFEEPWHSFREEWITGTNVYLFGSTADDIVSGRDILAIYSHLGGTGVPTSGTWNAVQENNVGSTITVGITSGVLHSYQMYSPKFAAFVNDALTEITGSVSTFRPWMFTFVYLGWFLGLAGLLLTLLSLNKGSKWIAADTVPNLLDTKKFLLHKALMWLPGTAAALVICCICVCMPLGSPVMNIPYMCFIAGYGIVMALAYQRGNFKGTSGKLPKLSFKVDRGKKALAVCCAVSIGLCFFVWYVLRATMYRLIPLNARLFWVTFATVIMAVGYYVSGCETDMLQKAGVGTGVKVIYNLIQYVPLFLLIGFYLMLRSYSGLIGQVQNMILMYVFCIPLGNYIKKKTGSQLFGAILTAFLFQTLMITSAALISIF